MIANVVAFERSVDDRPLLQGYDGGADKKWHEGEADPVALLKSALMPGAQVDDAREIDFVHAVDVGAGTARLNHALGDDLAHVRHGNEVAGVRSRRGQCGWTRGRWRGGWRPGSRSCGGAWRRRLALDEEHCGLR